MLRTIPRSRRSVLRSTMVAVAAALATITTLVAAPSAQAADNAVIVGWVEHQGKGVANIQVDLFQHARADGSGGALRGQFLRSTRTVSTGGLYFSVPAGCYVLTYVAPQGSTFTNGTRYTNRGTCVQSGQWAAHHNATLATVNWSTPTPAPSPTPTTQPAPTTTRPATTTAPAPSTTQPAPSTTTAPANGSCASGSTFETVFRDDFNGSSVNSAWHVYNSTGNAGFGLRRPSAVRVADGKLTITAANDSNGTIVSGGMSHNLNQTYGRFSFKVRTDNDPSQATSGVVLTWPQSNVHPRDGENNIYETLADSPNRNPFYSFIHKPYGTTSQQEYFEHHADGSQWQVMTMEWTPDTLTLRREGPGGQTWSETRRVDETGSNLIPDVPHHLSIQLDSWKHSIGSPVKMEVDWVEISKYCG